MGGTSSKATQRTYWSEGYDCENPKTESFVYPLNGTRGGFGFDSQFLDGFSSKGVKSIEALQRMENSNQQKNQTSGGVLEKFKGVAYKNKSIEPFEKTYINY